jgi:1,4-dihydroxy-2-naphthoate octaprenyltransferase
MQAVFTQMTVALSGLVGITTTVILFCAHFHQVEGDYAHGKMSPLVRMGTHKGTEVRCRAAGQTTTLHWWLPCVSGVASRRWDGDH